MKSLRSIENVVIETIQTSLSFCITTLSLRLIVINPTLPTNLFLFSECVNTFISFLTCFTNHNLEIFCRYDEKEQSQINMRKVGFIDVSTVLKPKLSVLNSSLR